MVQFYVVTIWRDVVCDSRCMTGTCDPFKMFSFSVMQSTFRFSNIEILAVPTTSLIYNFWNLGTVDQIFVGKNWRLDAPSALENYLWGLFTWREGAPANRATRGANFSYVSFGNALKRLHARQGSPPTRGTLSTWPRHPARRGSFLPCERFVPGYPG